MKMTALLTITLAISSCQLHGMFSKKPKETKEEKAARQEAEKKDKQARELRDRIARLSQQKEHEEQKLNELLGIKTRTLSNGSAGSEEKFTTPKGGNSPVNGNPAKLLTGSRDITEGGEGDNSTYTQKSPCPNAPHAIAMSVAAAQTTAAHIKALQSSSRSSSESSVGFGGLFGSESTSTGELSENEQIRRQLEDAKNSALKSRLPSSSAHSRTSSGGSFVHVSEQSTDNQDTDHGIVALSDAEAEENV